MKTTKPAAKQIKDMTYEERQAHMAAFLEEMRRNVSQNYQERDPR